MSRPIFRALRAGFLAGTLILALLAAVSPVLANANPSGTGQPSQSCQAAGVTPGHAADAPGSAFNPNGNAGTHYAGTQPQNSKNPKSVAQYDVACYQQSQHLH